MVNGKNSLVPVCDSLVSGIYSLVYRQNSLVRDRDSHVPVRDSVINWIYSVVPAGDGVSPRSGSPSLNRQGMDLRQRSGEWFAGN